MSISVLARVHPDRDVLVTDGEGRVLYWDVCQQAQDFVSRQNLTKHIVVYEAATRDVMLDRLGISADDLVHASSAVN